MKKPVGRGAVGCKSPTFSVNTALVIRIGALTVWLSQAVVSLARVND